MAFDVLTTKHLLLVLLVSVYLKSIKELFLFCFLDFSRKRMQRYNVFRVKPNFCLRKSLLPLIFFVLFTKQPHYIIYKYGGGGIMWLYQQNAMSLFKLPTTPLKCPKLFLLDKRI